MPEILVICTANVCRSPSAAAALAVSLAGGDRAGWHVTSAGIRASEGSSACPLALDEVEPAQRGALESHHAQQLTRELVADADLVVTAELTHRAAVARLDPRAAQRTFTLLEAARLVPLAAQRLRAEGMDADPDLDALVRTMHELRPTLPQVSGSERSGWFRRGARIDAMSPLDIPDGHGLGKREHHRAVAASIEAASEIARGIGAVRVPA